MHQPVLRNILIHKCAAYGAYFGRMSSLLGRNANLCSNCCGLILRDFKAYFY